MSEIIQNPRYPANTEIMLFHGTAQKNQLSFEKYGIRLAGTKNKKKGFGTGFYLTMQYWQAVDYAKRIAGTMKDSPIIVCCTVKAGSLRDLQEYLVIDEYNERWLSTIIRGRYDKENPLSHDFHWIYGRCGDGPTQDFEKAYNIGADSEILLRYTTPRLDYPHYNYDQLWLGTYDAIGPVKIAHIINVGNEVGKHDREPTYNRHQ